MKKLIIFSTILILVFGMLFYRFFTVTNTEANAFSEKESSPRPLSKDKLLVLIDRCEHGDAETCLIVGYVYLRGVSGERDIGKARDFFGKSCDGIKDPNKQELQCEAIAKIFETGKEARIDRKVAEEFHERAVQAHVSSLTFKPAQQTPDDIIKACERPSVKEEYPGKFCGLAGELFEFGRRGLQQDFEKAAKMYERACEVAENELPKNGFACDLAGLFFRDKKQNQHLAAAFFTKGCKLGLQASCEHFKKMGLPSDETL